MDADLDENYEEEEVEELIQVVLLCTQSSPLERPKMSEVVRMLEGEGLAEKWDKWWQKEDGNYKEEEVEELIQVTLLCTQSSPLERPKMSEVVRMLEGEGLAEKWDKWWEKELIIQQNFDPSNLHHAYWSLLDSTSNIPPDELSGPR